MTAMTNRSDGGVGVGGRARAVGRRSTSYIIPSTQINPDGRPREKCRLFKV